MLIVRSLPQTLTAEVEVNGYPTGLHHTDEDEVHLRPNPDIKGNRLSCYFAGLIVLYSEGEYLMCCSSQQRIEQVGISSVAVCGLAVAPSKPLLTRTRSGYRALHG